VTKTILRSCILALALAPAAASAGKDATPRPRKSPTTKTSASGKASASKPDKVKSFTFDPDDVDGSRLSPDGSTVLSVRAKKHASLIRLRTNFIPEILRQADML